MVRRDWPLQLNLSEGAVGRSRQVLRFYCLRRGKVFFECGIVFFDLFECGRLVKFDHFCVALGVNVLGEEIIDEHGHFGKVGLGRRFGWVASRVKRRCDFRIIERDRECYWFLRPAISAFGVIDDIDEFINWEREPLLAVLSFVLVDESQCFLMYDFFQFLDQSGRLDPGTHVCGVEDASDFDEVLEALGNASDGLICSTFEIVESMLRVCEAVFCDEPVC